MAYRVKEILYTLQGEGAHTGRPALFVRFSGCNLWSGSETDREGALCQFCDTDFFGEDGPGGGVYDDAAELREAALATWRGGTADRFVVCTGGEPLLQLDQPLLEAFHQAGFQVAVETNGSVEAPHAGIDWLTVSPKPGAPLRQRRGDELKLIYPVAGLDPKEFESLDFERFYLQPLDNAEKKDNTERTVAYCLAHPPWRLSLQTHKIIGIA